MPFALMEAAAGNGRLVGLVMSDVMPAEPPVRVSVAPQAAQLPRHVVAWSVALCAMVLALLLPALWNGFPFIFPDTGGYLTRPIEGALIIGRSALYGLFLYAGVPLLFWPNVIVQAALTVWLIVLTLRTIGLGGRPWLALGIVVMLTAGTGLPWFAGQLMPDIMFPLAVLALYLLAFRAGQLKRWESIALAAVIVFAIPSHMAAAGMCVGILAALWLMSRAGRLVLPRPRLWLATIAVAAGVALCPVSNFAITGQFAFTPGGPSFLFGRLIEDGIVGRYLDDRCPDPSLNLCAIKDQLPDNADDWLWGDNTFNRLGYEAWEPEEKAVIGATLRQYPFMHAVAAAADTVRQFVTFPTEISITDNDPTIATFADRVPQLYPQFMGARQQAGPFDMTPLNWIYVPVGAVAIAGLSAGLIWRRRLGVAPELAALALTVLLALCANAAICGIFSHPAGRYQARLVPLAPLAVAVLIARRHTTPPLSLPQALL